MVVVTLMMEGRSVTAFAASTAVKMPGHAVGGHGRGLGDDGREGNGGRQVKNVCD
jgi:hypothetical protein